MNHRYRRPAEAVMNDIQRIDKQGTEYYSPLPKQHRLKHNIITRSSIFFESGFVKCVF